MTTTIELDPSTLERLRGLTTATVTMQLLKRGIRRVALSGVKPLLKGQGVTVGEAYTLRFLPMREDLSEVSVLASPDYAPRKAIEDCPAGSILTIEARGIETTGTIGDILAARLKKRGVAALVCDGAIRDEIGVVAVGLPIWCMGAAAPASITELSGGGLQEPIGCGGVAIIPGDVLICDDDGVVCIPRHLADEVARDGVEQDRFEVWVQARIEEGRSTIGLYPPSAETRAEYEAWVKEQG
jgi:regulator of RNase E activity RraA